MRRHLWPFWLLGLALLLAACGGQGGGGNGGGGGSNGGTAGTVDTPGGQVQVSLQGGTFTQQPSSVQVNASGYQTPYGGVAFTARLPQAGGTLTVTLTFPQDIPQGAVLLKCLNGACNPIPGAQLQGRTATFGVQDGGPLDADGRANGQVQDPVALGVAQGGDTVAFLDTPGGRVRISIEGGTFTERPTGFGAVGPDQPFGGIAFTANVPVGGGLRVTLSLPSPLDRQALLASGAGIPMQTLSPQGQTVTYELVDGEYLDEDNARNGLIVHHLAVALYDEDERTALVQTPLGPVLIRIYLHMVGAEEQVSFAQRPVYRETGFPRADLPYGVFSFSLNYLYQGEGSPSTWVGVTFPQRLPPRNAVLMRWQRPENDPLTPVPWEGQVGYYQRDGASVHSLIPGKPGEPTTVEIALFTLPQAVSLLTVTNDTLAQFGGVGDNGAVAYYSGFPNGKVYYWTPSGGTVVLDDPTASGSGYTVGAPVLSPDGNRVAWERIVPYESCFIKVWEPGTGVRVLPLPSPPSPWQLDDNCIRLETAFSPNGRYIAGFIGVKDPAANYSTLTARYDFLQGTWTLFPRDCLASAVANDGSILGVREQTGQPCRRYGPSASEIELLGQEAFFGVRYFTSDLGDEAWLSNSWASNLALARLHRWTRGGGLQPFLREARALGASFQEGSLLVYYSVHGPPLYLWRKDWGLVSLSALYRPLLPPDHFWHGFEQVQQPSTPVGPFISANGRYVLLVTTDGVGSPASVVLLDRGP